MSLEGKRALVTGSSKNIGKGMALQVGAAGAITYVTARTLDDTAAEVHSHRRERDAGSARGGRRRRRDRPQPATAAADRVLAERFEERFCLFLVFVLTGGVHGTP